MEDSRAWSRVLADQDRQPIQLKRADATVIEGVVADQSAWGIAVELPPSTSIEVGDQFEVVVGTQRQVGIIRHLRREPFCLRVGLALN